MMTSFKKSRKNAMKQTCLSIYITKIQEKKKKAQKRTNYTIHISQKGLTFDITLPYASNGKPEYMIPFNKKGKISILIKTVT